MSTLPRRVVVPAAVLASLMCLTQASAETVGARPGDRSPAAVVEVDVASPAVVNGAVTVAGRALTPGGRLTIRVPGLAAGSIASVTLLGASPFGLATVAASRVTVLSVRLPAGVVGGWHRIAITAPLPTGAASSAGNVSVSVPQLALVDVRVST